MLTSKASCLAAVLGAGAGEAAGLRARPSSSGPSLGCRSEEKQCGEMSNGETGTGETGTGEMVRISHYTAQVLSHTNKCYWESDGKS